MSPEITLQLITLASGAGYAVFNAWQTARKDRLAVEATERDRKWKLEDEERKAEQDYERLRREREEAADRAKAALESVVRSVRGTLEREMRTTRREVRRGTERVSADLRENTSLNAEALSAANHVNLKLAQITHALRVAISNTDPAAAEQLAEIERVALDLEDVRDRMAAVGANGGDPQGYDTTTSEAHDE